MLMLLCIMNGGYFFDKLLTGNIFHSNLNPWPNDPKYIGPTSQIVWWAESDFVSVILLLVRNHFHTKVIVSLLLGLETTHLHLRSQ